MSTDIKIPKKLIEVALPLDDINAAAAKEKSIRHGHPSTLHLWWARRPLAAARAVIFAQMVNDPGYQQGGGFKYGVNKEKAAIEREKLFDIIRDLVKWENTNNEEVLNRAREAIKKSWQETCELNKSHPQADKLFNPGKLPAFHDPFAGGGAIPLEAQRLGLESYASDLNPVAVMINKAMIEIPPKFLNREPIGPSINSNKQNSLVDEWTGSLGLAEDIRRYGRLMRSEVNSRIGDLYPNITITKHIAQDRDDLKTIIGVSVKPIAYIWARTVPSPSPAYGGVSVPLITTYRLSSKKGQCAWIEPVLNGTNYSFTVRTGPSIPKDIESGTKQGRGASFKCIVSGAPINSKYIKEQAVSNGFGKTLIAIVVVHNRKRLFLPPCDEAIHIDSSDVEWMPNSDISNHPQYMGVVGYGMTKFSDLFTNRQLVSINSYMSQLGTIKQRVFDDSINAGYSDTKSKEYSVAIFTYLALAISRWTDINNALCMWESSKTQVRHLFVRQAIPILWDFAEANIFADAAGDFFTTLSTMSKVIERLQSPINGHVIQHDAASHQKFVANSVISSDPPYYDNVPYADLSDFFYVWMRHCLKEEYPDIFGTLSSPKSSELVADRKRWDGEENAEAHFMSGMQKAINNMEASSNKSFPITLYYAFKQSETSENTTFSTGWETFLQSIVDSGLEITGTWPLRTELSNRIRGMGANALASSIVLVCKRRKAHSSSISRRQFQRILREDLPEALEAMVGGDGSTSPVAPVDLAQAAIGPGMAIFSRYEAVLNQDGSAMSIHDALILINRAITEYLNPDTGNFDNDTLFCDSWFSEYGWSAGDFGQANVLAQAKGTTVDGVRDAGVIKSGGGKVRLLKWQEYPTDWDPKQDNRTPVWEALHHLIRAINQQGESGAGELLARMPERGESIRQLAYHLYTLCERKGWAEDARAYNELITAWHAIVAASHDTGHIGEQVGLDI